MGVDVVIHDQTPGRRRLQTIHVERPRCPACGGVVLRKYRSLVDQGDGTAIAWLRSQETRCGHRFRVVWE
jgi:hypothetical protein